MGGTLALWTLAALAAVVLPTSVTSAAPDPPPAQAPRDGWPDTPAGAMARRWVKAFSKGEPAMRTCLAQHLAPESLAERGIPARMESYRALRERLGDLMLVRIVSSTPERVVAALATSALSEREFTFEVQPRPPHKLLRVSFKDPRGGHGGRGGHGSGSPH